MAADFALLPTQLDYYLIRDRQAHSATRQGEKLLREATKDLEKELFAKWVPYVLRPAKLPSRSMRKIEEMISENPNETVEGAIDKLKDLAGARILIFYLGDVWKTHDLFCRFLKKHPRLARIDGPPEDYNINPKRSGYRGLHQGVLIKIDTDVYFPFEVQFLTLLQADWAWKEHLVYEHSSKIPDYIKVKLRELSDFLDSASRASDELRKEIDSVLNP